MPVLLPLLVIGGVFAVAYIGFSKQPTSGGDSPFTAGMNAGAGLGLPPSPTLADCMRGTATGLGSGASAGAAAGTAIVPVLGTLVGAFIGAIAGGTAASASCNPTPGTLGVDYGPGSAGYTANANVRNRYECFSECDTAHPNHSIFSGGRAWRDCKDACREQYPREGGIWAGV